MKAPVSLCGAITALAIRRAALSPSSDELYAKGCALEDVNPFAAREAYQRALAQDPNHADSHMNLGRLVHTWDVHRALFHYRAALAIRPGDSTAAFNVGVALEDIGLVDEAIAAYAQSIASDPNHAEAHYNRGSLCERTGRMDDAAMHWAAYCRLTQAGSEVR